MKKEGKYISIKTLVMSTVLIMAVGTALFLTVEADSPDWDVNDDGYCNLLDVNQVAYYVGSNNPDYDVNNDGIVNQYDIQLVESHCDWQSGSPSGSGNFANTLVYVTPAHTDVAAGQSFSVDIYCEPGEVIRGFQFDLNFDASKLQVCGVVTNVGKIWSDQGHPVYSNPGAIDNTNGKITYVYATIKDDVETDVDGIFATITFTASTTSIGSSTLDLDNVKVTNLNDYVTTVVTDGTSEVFKNVQNTDTSEWFLTIQAAIDDPQTLDTHTIVASAGLYTEAVTIDKGLTLLGATSGDCKTSFTLPATLGAYDDTVQSVIKAPPGNLDAVTIEVSNVVFKGFVVEALDRTGSGGSNCNLINLQPPGSTPATMTGIVIENNVIGPNTDAATQTKGRHGLRFTAGYGHTISADVTCNMIYGTYGNGNNVFIWGTAYGMTGVPPIGPGPAILSDTNIHNNNICFSARSGVELSGAQTGLTIHNNDIHDNGVGYIGDDSAMKYGLGIAFVRDYTALQYGTYSPLGAAAGCVDGVTITNNEIYNNDKNGIYMGPMNKNHVITGNDIYDNGNSARGSGSTFGPGDGIRIDLNGDYYPGWPQTAQYGSTSNIAANNNNIYNNVGYGAQVKGTPTNGFILDAECNWWNHCSGPTHSGNPLGCGDAASDYVDYLPWLDASSPSGSCIGGDCADPVYVDDDYISSEPGWNIDHFATIQDGIDRVCVSGTVYVYDGTYTITSPINVNKGVTITGNIVNPENVLVKYNPASSTLNCVEVNSADVTIQGIKVQDCKNGFYFDRNVNTNTGVTISNCIIKDVSGWGIGEISSPNTVISYNTITNAGDKGIYFRLCEGTSESNRCEAISNVISGCGQPAIQTYGSKYAYIYGNTISSTNDKGINIIQSSATGTSDRIQVIGNTISETKWPGIQVIGAPYTYVYSNTLTKCNYHGSDGTGDWDYASIHVQDDAGPTYSHYTVIDSNTVSDGINGIQTWSDDVTITNNNIYNMGLTYADTKGTAGLGDGVYYNSGIIIGSNWLTGNFKPTGTTITGNDIHNNYWGLYVRDYITLSPGDSSVLSVTAECNWWGTAYGPLATDNVGAETGDSVSDYVDYTKWLDNHDVCTELPEYDINMDNIINIVDINAVAALFGTTCSPDGGIREDVSDDGDIDILDLQMVAYYFNEGGWE